jgi:3-deoxy-D-manno-octulosonate 8-phosphate phosphatase (KDO 8-P phosphatase)
MEDSSSIQKRAAHIKLLLMDCDGVLTDGQVWILENSDDQKTFNVRDGLGLALLHRAGLKSGVISGRTSSALERRARDMGMEFIRQGRQDKITAFEEVLLLAGRTEAEVAYVGDDLLDIPLMRRVEFAVAVADASAETKSHAHYVTKAPGGKGAIREVVEIILKTQGRWHDLVASYLK